MNAAAASSRSVVNDMNGCGGLSDRRHALRPVANNELNVMESGRAVVSIAFDASGYRRRRTANVKIKYYRCPFRWSRFSGLRLSERRASSHDRSGLDDWLLDKTTVSLFETVTQARRLTRSRSLHVDEKCLASSIIALLIACNERAVSSASSATQTSSFVTQQQQHSPLMLMHLLTTHLWAKGLVQYT